MRNHSAKAPLGVRRMFWSTTLALFFGCSPRFGLQGSQEMSNHKCKPVSSSGMPSLMQCVTHVLRCYNGISGTFRVLVMESWPGSRHVKNLRLCRVNAKDLTAARHKSKLKAGWLKDTQKSASFTGLHHSKRFTKNSNGLHNRLCS